jgi:hypothetical protein
MFLTNQQITYRLSIIALLMMVLTGCATTVPHQGCYVTDSQLRGRYTGECRGSKAYGWGKTIGQDTYEGEFIDGVPNGKGTYVWRDGDKYVGQVRNGKAHGQGVMIYANGTTRSGLWQNNRLVQ